MKLIIKTTLLSALFFLNMFFITGCWDYRELDEMAIVAGVAIDKEGDKYLLTVEISNVPSGKEAKPESKIVSEKGDTIFDAIRNIIKTSGKELYWGHSDIIILSQEIAREGIIQAIDLFSRDPEARMSTNLLISKEKTAAEILEQQSTTSAIHAKDISRMLASQYRLSKAPVIEVHQFVNTLTGGGKSAVLPAIGVSVNQGKSNWELSGTAVFKKDKLIGFLDGEDTKYFLFVINKVKAGSLIQKESTEGPKVNVTLEILPETTKTKIKPVYSDGKLSMELDVSITVAIAEIGGSENYISEPGLSKLKKDAEKSLENNIKRVVKKVQNDYDSDIFGFGSIIKDDMPDVWREIENDWEEIYKDLDISVNSDIEIINSALLLKPIKIGD
jgi:spore germination protein KC